MEATMVDKVSEVMTRDPITLASTDTLANAAKRMRDADVGDVIVVEGDAFRGLVTDRDIVVRGVAEDLDPFSTALIGVCTGEVVTLKPDDSIDTAVRLVREHAVRRLPVVAADGRPVGIVSIGDLAVERDTDSALAEVSAAEPNN
jgi:CBS domain-containing protein